MNKLIKNSVYIILCFLTITACNAKSSYKNILSDEKLEDLRFLKDSKMITKYQNKNLTKRETYVDNDWKKIFNFKPGKRKKVLKKLYLIDDSKKTESIKKSQITLLKEVFDNESNLKFETITNLKTSIKNEKIVNQIIKISKGLSFREEQWAELFSTTNNVTIINRLKSYSIFIRNNIDINELKRIFGKKYLVGPNTKKLFNNDFSSTNIDYIIKNNKRVSQRSENSLIEICLKEMEQGYKPVLEILEYILSYFNYLLNDTDINTWKKVKNVWNPSNKLITESEYSLNFERYISMFPFDENSCIFPEHLFKAISLIKQILNNHTICNNYKCWEKIESDILELIKKYFYNISSLLTSKENLRNIFNGPILKQIIKIENRNKKTVNLNNHKCYVEDTNNAVNGFPYRQTISINPLNLNTNGLDITYILTENDPRISTPTQFSASMLNSNFVDLSYNNNIKVIKVGNKNNLYETKASPSDIVVFAFHGSLQGMDIYDKFLNKTEINSESIMNEDNIKFKTLLKRLLKPNGKLILWSCSTGNTKSYLPPFAKVLSYLLPYPNNEIIAPQIDFSHAVINVEKDKQQVDVKYFPQHDYFRTKKNCENIDDIKSKFDVYSAINKFNKINNKQTTSFSDDLD